MKAETGNQTFKGTFLAQATHPFICILHFWFKAAALLWYSPLSYIFLTLFISSIPAFVTVQLLCAIDFWVVQNITGRILVGLRWRTVVTENGGERWVFESWPEEKQPNGVDRFAFWLGLVVSPLVWGLFFGANLLTFNPFWVPFTQSLSCFLSLCLGVGNCTGYWKCRSDHKRKLQRLLGHGALTLMQAK